MEKIIKLDFNYMKKISNQLMVMLHYNFLFFHFCKYDVSYDLLLTNHNMVIFYIFLMVVFLHLISIYNLYDVYLDESYSIMNFDNKQKELLLL